MKKEFIIRKCLKCGAMVEVLNDCTCENCGIKCCGDTMQTLVPNTVDASIEKHKPVIEVVGSYIVVSIPHVMENEHFIEWIALASETITAKKYLTKGGQCKAVFPYIPGSTVYAYCNLHGIWSTDVQ